jgi:hypothetical protein
MYLILKRYQWIRAKLAPGLIKQAPRHIVLWGSGGIVQPFLISDLDRGELSASRPSCFTPENSIPGTHCIGT